MTIDRDVKSLLKEWDTIKQEMAPLKEALAPLAEKEALLRRSLAAKFKDVVEGSKNSIPLANGYSLKLTHKVKRSVDEAAFKTLHKELVDAGIPMAMLFREEHALEKAIYSKLPVEQREKVDAVLQIKDEAPVLELVAPKPAK